MWLRKFGLDFKCIRLIPYEIDNKTLGLEGVTIIPLPEAEDYVIKVEKKENEISNLTVTQQEYLKFYSELAKRLQNSKPYLEMQKPQPRSYYPIGIKGAPGVHFEWGFHGRPRSSFGVELHFEKANRNENISLLNEVASKI